MGGLLAHECTEQDRLDAPVRHRRFHGDDVYHLVRRSVGEAEEVAALIHFLAADDCGYVTGEAVLVDGGWRAGPSLGSMEKLRP